MNEEPHGDMCEGEGGAGGGGLVDEVSYDTCGGGGGGGISMYDASANTSGLGRGGRPRRIGGGLVNNVASGDTCDGE